MNCQKRPKNSDQVLLSLGHIHRLRETAKGNVEELLHHLIADNALARIRGLSDEQ